MEHACLDDDDYTARINEAARLLPSWFIPRMMDDTWTFGLLLDTGHLLVINTILGVGVSCGEGGIWIDVKMATSDSVDAKVIHWAKAIFAPTSRTTASVQVSKIVMAIELADT